MISAMNNITQVAQAMNVVSYVPLSLAAMTGLSLTSFCGILVILTE